MRLEYQQAKRKAAGECPAAPNREQGDRDAGQRQNRELPVQHRAVDPRKRDAADDDQIAIGMQSGRRAPEQNAASGVDENDDREPQRERRRIAKRGKRREQQRDLWTLDRNEE